MDAAAYATLPRVVLDNGSGCIKIGMALSKKPPHVVPNCVGRPKRKVSLHYSETHSSAASEQASGSEGHSRAESAGYVSDACYTLVEYFCNRPQAAGLLYDANRQRQVWERFIGTAHLTNNNGVVSPGNALSVNPELAGICVTEPNLCPPQARQVLAELIFEDLGFPVACFLPSQTASAHLFESLARRKGRAEFSLNCYPHKPASHKPEDFSCCLVVDCGFSATHAVPFVNGQPVQNAALRSAVAGFQCTSYLKNVTALRAVNLEFNELVVQHVGHAHAQMKEESCYVSMDFDLELRAAKNLLKLYRPELLCHNYTLPNYTSRTHFTSYLKPPPPLLTHETREAVKLLAEGKIKDPEELDALYKRTGGGADAAGASPNERCDPGERPDDPGDQTSRDENETQTINMFAERFSVPEILFNPQGKPRHTPDVKLNECGVVDLAYRSMAMCPPVFQPHLASNIFVCGGSSKFPGFVERFYQDLRPLVPQVGPNQPQAWDIGVYAIDDPALAAFHGARLWTTNDELFLGNAITRNVYLENGGSVIKINELIREKAQNR